MHALDDGDGVVADFLEDLRVPRLEFVGGEVGLVVLARRRRLGRAAARPRSPRIFILSIASCVCFRLVRSLRCSIVGPGCGYERITFSDAHDHFDERITIIDLLRPSQHCSINVIRTRARPDGEDFFMTRLLCAVAPLCCSSLHPLARRSSAASIEGTVRDSSGGVLPGVTVEARSPSLVGVQSAVTDDAGRVSLSGAAARAIRDHRDAARILARAVSRRTARARAECCKIDLDAGGRRRDRDRPGDRRARRSSTSSRTPRARTSRREIIERIPQGPRLHGARDVGARRHRRDAQPRHPDRRRQRRRQSLHDRRRRHDQSADRHVRQRRSRPTSCRKCRSSRAATTPNTARRSAASSAPSPSRGGNQYPRRARASTTRNDRLHGDVRPSLRLVPSEHERKPNTSPRRWTTSPTPSRSSISAGRSCAIVCGSTPATIRTGRKRRARSGSSQPADRHVRIQADRPALQLQRHRPGARQNLRGRFAARTSGPRGLTLPGIERDGTSHSNPSQFPMTNRTDQLQRLVLRRARLGRRTTRPTSTSRRPISPTVREGVGTFSDSLRHVFNGANVCNPNAVQGRAAVRSRDSRGPATAQWLLGLPVEQPRRARRSQPIQHQRDITRYLTWRGQHTLKAGVQFEHIENSVLSGAQARQSSVLERATTSRTTASAYRGRYGHYNVTRHVITAGGHHCRQPRPLHPGRVDDQSTG